jgi:hypothetical protein
MLMVVIPPGGECGCDLEQWRDTLVVVECGSVELASVYAGSIALRQGSVLSLDRMRSSRMRNVGDSAVILTLASRRC